MNRDVVVAVASGSEDLIPTLLDKLRAIAGGAEMWLVSEFQAEGARWVPYHPGRTLAQNLALCRAALGGRTPSYVGLILQPRMPYWTMRLLAWKLGGFRTVFFNENLDHFMLRPRSAATILRHVAWRTRNFARWELRPGGTLYTFLWRLAHPRAFARPLRAAAARLAGRVAVIRKETASVRPVTTGLADRPPGVSVVIPSRDGRALLEQLLASLGGQLHAAGGELIVVDNGSSDGTSQWLAAHYPEAVCETSECALSFARAVNRGIARARFSHVLVLNNDMVAGPDFFPPLLEAFRRVPDLFCATAQIRFPPGARREETGKAVMPPRAGIEEFPVTCIEPLEGENLTPVLYGSGGCSMYDGRKLEALGGFLEIYEPAYVEDLDLGFRGWQQGWPTVFVSGSKVEHRHRATTSRYYTPAELDQFLEVNYLRFLARTVSTPDLFSRLWKRAVLRLNARAARMNPDRAAGVALRLAPRIALEAPRTACAWPEEKILAIGSGDVAVFPGRPARGKPVVLVVSPYLPYPLSHGGAVRMYNLMREAARDYDLVLVCFADELAAAPEPLRELCVEIATVRRHGSHGRPLTARPDGVEEFDSPAFRAVLELEVRNWTPAVAQLEFTQMAQYAASCRPARVILVEHDLTLDLYRQLLDAGHDWETGQQYERWVRFEKAAWNEVDSIVTMSEKDRASVGSPKAVVLPNGVDLSRFTIAETDAEPGRLLFIGSFAHLPNVLAVDFFLREIWPLVRARTPVTLHVIAGSRHRYYLERSRDRVAPPLGQDGVEVEDFVPDPRAAYQRAGIVIAPLVASAGTNIKIMEAMAMGKAIVSTPAGINGLDDLRPGVDLLVERDPAAFATAVVSLVENPARRESIGRQARATAELRYGWDAIGRLQRDLYESLLASTA